MYSFYFFLFHFIFFYAIQVLWGLFVVLRNAFCKRQQQNESSSGTQGVPSVSLRELPAIVQAWLDSASIPGSFLEEALAGDASNPWLPSVTDRGPPSVVSVSSGSQSWVPALPERADGLLESSVSLPRLLELLGLWGEGVSVSGSWFEQALLEYVANPGPSLEGWVQSSDLVAGPPVDIRARVAEVVKPRGLGQRRGWRVIHYCRYDDVCMMYYPITRMDR